MRSIYGGLVQIVQREGRIILTKDGRLLERQLFTSGQLEGVRVWGDHFIEQIRQVVTELGVDTTKDFTRCIECNAALLAVAKEDVKDIAPPYAFQSQEEFKQCPICHRVYWQGIHWHNMWRELAQALDGDP